MARKKRDTSVADEMSQRTMIKDENRKGKGGARKKKGRKKSRK